MCVAGGDRDGTRLAAWPVVALLALALVGIVSLKSALTAWPGSDGLPATFQAAITDLEQTTGDLAPADRVRAGASARVLLEHAQATLIGLNGSALPLVDPAGVRDLVFAEEAIRTVAGELRAGEDRPAGAAAAEIETLTREALARLRRVDRRLAESAETAGGSIVRVEDRGDHWRVWRTDRGLHELVRALGIALLLGGCLAVALRLLGRTRPVPALSDLLARPAAAMGVIAFAIFLTGSLGLVARPSVLPGVSTAVTSLARPGPCSRLEIARDVFWTSDTLGIGALTERARRRVQARVRDCLGLDSMIAARQATGRFLARAAGSGDRERHAMVPAAAAPSISLALMPEMRQEVAHMRASIETLLHEVATLRPRDGAQAIPAPIGAEPGTGGPEIPLTVTEAGSPLPDTRSGPDDAELRPNPPSTPARVAARTEPPVPAADGPRPVVTTTAVNYRSGPSRDATKLGTLQKGTRVRLVSEESGWASVRLHDGRAAYVASTYLEPIE